MSNIFSSVLSRRTPTDDRNIASRTFAMIALCLLMLSTGCGKSGEAGTISGSGTIEATEVNVASKIPAEITSLKIEEGSLVKKGDTLAIVDHDGLDIQLREAEANVEATKAQAALLHSGARPEDILAAQESVQQIGANRKLAEQDLARIESLLTSEAATKEQRDQARTKLDVLRSQEQSARSAVSKVQKLTRPEETDQALARVHQAEATRDRVKQQIEDCYITSPLDGIVTHKVVEQGEVVGAGATIATITETGKVNVMIYVTEEELPHVKVGQSAKVTVDGMPNKSFSGTVIYVSPEAEFTPKNIQTKDDRVKLVFGVKIEVPNTSDQLKRGLPADATLLTK